MRARRASPPASTLFCLALSLSVCATFLIATPARAEGASWFVSFEGIEVGTGTSRNSVTQLVDAGSIETDGFSELVFSFGGEFKGPVPASGMIGAILLPDEEIFDYLLRNEGHFAFPLEVKFSVQGLKTHVFLSQQQTAKIGFPRYRIYLYNETSTAASVSLFVYRTRR
jgi:hypothetical protein